MPSDDYQGPDKDITGMLALVLAAAGASEDNAKLVAEHLAEAELAGRESHGVRMLELYVDRLLIGQISGRSTPRIVMKSGPVLQIDGQKAFGQIVGDFAAANGVSRAKTYGVCLVTVQNAGHFGRNARWPEYAARNDVASIHFVHGFGAVPSVVPFGGVVPKLRTGPMALGAPSADGRHVILDFSVAEISANTVRLAAERGQKLPFAALMRRDGAVSDDPTDFTAGTAALLPFGGFKGYGLAVFANIFAGIIAAAGRADDGSNSMLSIYFDVRQLTDWDLYKKELETFAEELRQTPTVSGQPYVYVPGDRSRSLVQGASLQLTPAVRASIWSAARKAGATPALVARWPAAFKAVLE